MSVALQFIRPSVQKPNKSKESGWLLSKPLNLSYGKNTLKQRKGKTLVTLLGSSTFLGRYKNQRRQTPLFKTNEESNIYQPNWKPTFTNCLQEMR